MGYMGLGMQSWVYKMKPRKPFSCIRKNSFTSLPNHKGRKFKIQHSKESSKFYIIISFTLIFLLFSFVIIKRNDFLDHSSLINKEINERIQREDIFAFNFLFNSGKRRLKSRNLVGAYSEFKLAYNLRPNDIELKQLLLETITLLCDKNESFCSEYELFDF